MSHAIKVLVMRSLLSSTASIKVTVRVWLIVQNLELEAGWKRRDRLETDSFGSLSLFLLRLKHGRWPVGMRNVSRSGVANQTGG
jgi:hypothetical protein